MTSLPFLFGKGLLEGQSTATDILRTSSTTAEKS
jgi:hypothetical protein